MTSASARADRAEARARWSRALGCARLLAVDPHGLGGALLRVDDPAQAARWLAALAPVTVRRVPLHADDDRLFGGLDLSASLAAARVVVLPGLLAQADGGLVQLSMLDRIAPGRIARLCAVLDRGALPPVRGGDDGTRSRFGVIAIDDVDDPARPPPPALVDRVAFVVDLRGLDPRDAPPDAEAAPLDRLRSALSGVTIDGARLHALGEAADALGVASIRVLRHAMQAARVQAACRGHDRVDDEDATIALERVVVPRATRWPSATDPEAPSPEPSAPDDAPDDGPPAEPSDADPESPGAPESSADGPDATPARRLPDRLLEATRSALPAGLLDAAVVPAAGAPRGAAGVGRAGALRRGGLRGAPAGVRVGRPGGGHRLALVDTLRAALPWQGLRRREAGPRDDTVRVRVRLHDLRVRRFAQRSETTTVFAVDASGSAAMHRLAEAKGAVERLLAECYVRRDRVAVVAFRGQRAELLLAPTRSLVRARRSLAALPGGGGTPLADGLDAADAVIDGVLRRGGTPVLVVLTDGRANVARRGGGREVAQAQALDAARRIGGRRIAALLIDTSPQPREAARVLGEAMGARYLPMPHLDSGRLVASLRRSGGRAGPDRR